MDANTIKPREAFTPNPPLASTHFPTDFIAQAFAGYTNRHPASGLDAAGYEEQIADAYKSDTLAIHRLVVKFSTKWASTDYHIATRQVFTPRLPEFITAFKTELLAGHSPAQAADHAAVTANVGVRPQLIALNLPVPFEYVAPPPAVAATTPKKTRRRKTPPKATPPGAGLPGLEN